MSFAKKIIVLLCFFLASCSNIEFVYSEKGNLTNPFYNKVSYKFNGKNIPSIYRHASKYFGNTSSPEYYLEISISEEKTIRSVESNQAVNKLDYKLNFNYLLKRVEDNCLVYQNDLISRFSFVPKSSGYNFGSDQSLEKMYELATKRNLVRFSNKVGGINLSSCKNEN